MTDLDQARARVKAAGIPTLDELREKIPAGLEVLGRTPAKKKTPKNFGRHDLMVLAAFRYCLGRRTYIVSDCAGWLTQQWENFTPSVQVIIERELREAAKEDAQERESGGKFRPLGDDCDRSSWLRVLAMIDSKQAAP